MGVRETNALIICFIHCMMSCILQGFSGVDTKLKDESPVATLGHYVQVKTTISPLVIRNK